jgi:hypothetical protein
MSISTTNVTTVGNVVYTSSGNTAVTFLSLCNYGAGNLTANLYIVPSGGSVGNGTISLASLQLISLDTYQIYSGGEKLLLENGDAITVDASSNTVTAVVSYTSI